MIMIENREWNTSADAKLTAVSRRGKAVCQTRSPVWSDRFPHQTIMMEARAKGMELRSPVCILVRPYDLIICGCQICRPLLIAVLPAKTTLSARTCLLHSTRHTLICPTDRAPPLSPWSFPSNQSR